MVYLISSSFDATGLETYISFGDNIPSSTSCVVKNRTEFKSIPLNVEDLWIGRLDITEITDYSFNRFLSLKSFVIGNGIFWEISSFQLDNLLSLQSIDIGKYCFRDSSSFSLTGLVVSFESFTDLPQLQSVKLGYSAFYDVHSVVFESDGMSGLMIQICQICRLLNLIMVLLMVMIMIIERRLLRST